MKQEPSFDFYSFHFSAPQDASPAAAPAAPDGDSRPPLRDRAALKEARHAYSLAGCSLILTVVLSLVASAALTALALSLFPTWLDQAWFSVVSGTLPMYLLGAALMGLLFIGLPRRTPERGRFGAVRSMGAFCAMFTMMLVGSLVGNGLTELIGNLAGYDFSPATESLTQMPLWVMAATTLVLAPLFEELIFRKLLIDRLLPYGELGAVVTSALLFGLIHGNFQQFFYAALLGALLSIVYLRTGSLLRCVLLHALFNLFGGFFPLLLQHPSLDEALVTLLMAGYGLLILLLAFIGLIALLVYLSRPGKLCPVEGELPRGVRARALLGNAGMILALVFSAAYFALFLVLSAVPA